MEDLRKTTDDGDLAESRPEADAGDRMGLSSANRAKVGLAALLTLAGCVEGAVVDLQEPAKVVADSEMKDSEPVFGKISAILGTDGIRVIGNSKVSTLVDITLKRNGTVLESKSFFVTGGQFQLEMPFHDAKEGDEVLITGPNGRGYRLIITRSGDFPEIPED